MAMLIRDVEIRHRVKPDGKGHERVYSILDGFLLDRPGLVRNYPYGALASNIFDWSRRDYIFGKKAEMRTEWNELGRYRTLLSVELDTRKPEEVVVRSTLPEGLIRRALENVE